MYLFAGLEYLNTVKIGSNFAACKDTKDPINLTYMFAACNYLMKVDISGLCEGLEYDMSYMCYGNARLMSLELPKYQIYLSAAYQAFYQCVLIKSLDFTNFVFLNGVYNYQDML